MVWDRNGNTRAGRSSCDGKRRWGWAGAGRSDNPVAAGLINPCYLSALAAPSVQAATAAGRSAGRLGPGPVPALGLAFQRGVAAAQVSPQRQSIWPWPSQEEGAKQVMLHGEEPYVLVQGQFDPPRRAAAHQIEQLLEGQFMAGGNPIQVQCSSARQMRWPADPGGGSVLGARRQGLGQKRLQGSPICWHRSASPSPAFRGTATASTSQASALILSRRPIQVRS